LIIRPRIASRTVICLSLVPPTIHNRRNHYCQIKLNRIYPFVYKDKLTDVVVDLKMIKVDVGKYPLDGLLQKHYDCIVLTKEATDKYYVLVDKHSTSELLARLNNLVVK
jgi:hypothetical protein